MLDAADAERNDHEPGMKRTTATHRPPRISVIMPAHNVAPFIARAIRSVLSQDHPSFELLVGDDGSTDETRDVVERFRGDRRVRTYFARRRRGAAAMRNELIRRARGRYLSICDSDDIMLPGNLTALAALLDEDRRLGVAHGDIVERRSSRLPDPGPPATLGAETVWKRFFPVPPHGGSLIRKSVLQRTGGYNARYRTAEDYDLMMRLAEVAGVRHLAGVPCYVWCRRPGSLTTTLKPGTGPDSIIYARALARRRAMRGRTIR
jgi:glycosyltransferase involved in cell wall biosynthesis